MCGPVERPRAASVVELVERLARTRPSTPALEWNGSRLTFGELWRRSLTVADEASLLRAMHGLVEEVAV
jgi:hypothetical protein